MPSGKECFCGTSRRHGATESLQPKPSYSPILGRARVALCAPFARSRQSFSNAAHFFGHFASSAAWAPENQHAPVSIPRRLSIFAATRAAFRPESFCPKISSDQFPPSHGPRPVSVLSNTASPTSPPAGLKPKKSATSASASKACSRLTPPSKATAPKLISQMFSICPCAFLHTVRTLPLTTSIPTPYALCHFKPLGDKSKILPSAFANGPRALK